MRLRCSALRAATRAALPDPRQRPGVDARRRTTPHTRCPLGLIAMPGSDATALHVSIASAAFTGGGLIAQALLYYFNGARLKVELVFCYRTEFGRTLYQTAWRKQPTWQDWQNKHDLKPNHELGIEYAKVRVTNIGRTSVSVEDISLDLGRVHWFRRWRITVTPMQFVDHDDKSSVRLDLNSPHRLDPGANVTASFHLWPTFGSPDLWEHRRFRGLTVRGSARAVGRRPTRSRRRQSLDFKRGDLSAPDVRVYRVLWQGNYDEMVGYLPLLMRRQLFERLQEGATEKDLTDYLNEVDREPQAHNPNWRQSKYYDLVTHEVHHAFHHTAASWLWPDVDPADAAHRDWRSCLRRVLWGQRVRRR
jgi:hypothetical protein